MIWIIIFAIVSFRIIVYPSLVRYLLVRKIMKSAKRIDEMFAEMEKYLDDNEKKS